MMRKFLNYLLGISLIAILSGLMLWALRTPTVVPQPVAFPHNTHVKANEMECVFCHQSVDSSTVAGFPSVTQCMLCHQAVKTESPEIQKLAAFAERNEEPPWVRIYGFTKEAAVYFSHKRHIKAGVKCAVCHGNVADAMEMKEEIHWTMGKCIDCHRANQASVDCLTCHL